MTVRAVRNHFVKESLCLNYLMKYFLSIKISKYWQNVSVIKYCSRYNSIFRRTINK